jgi:hypothetical protein
MMIDIFFPPFLEPYQQGRGCGFVGVVHLCSLKKRKIVAEGGALYLRVL